MTSNPLEAFLAAGELRPLLLGWFLWAPTALLVPALGWLNAPLAPRLALGFGLGLAVTPHAAPHGPAAEGFWAELGRALLLGGVVAVGVAAVFWAALMVGGVADRTWPGRPRSDGAEGPLPRGPTSLLFGLLTALFFLAGGGPSRVSEALTELAWSANGGYAERIADTCVASVTLAVTVATPVLVATLLLEGISGLVARSAPPLIVDTLLGPLKALAFLFLLAVALEPMTAVLTEALGL